MAHKAICTLGTSNRTWEEFLGLLRGLGIEVVVDVRRFPTSRWEHFRRPELAGLLEAAGISYVYLGQELGGYRKEGYQSYLESDGFRRGLALVEGLAERHRVAMVCAERLPWRCHRRFIGRDLEGKGWQVNHVIDEKRRWVPK